MLSFKLQHLRKSCCLLLAGSLLLGSCENDINEVRALGNQSYNTEEAIDVTSYLSIGGVVKAKLTAPQMIATQTDTTSMAFPKSLYVIFYDDSTHLPTTFVSANYGIYYKRLDKVKLTDSVLAYTITGDTLSTNELWWDQNTEMIYSDSPAVIRQADGSYLPGKDGFHAKQDFTELFMLNTNNGDMAFDEQFINSGSSPQPTGTDSVPPTADSTRSRATATPGTVTTAPKAKPRSSTDTN